MTFSFAFNVLNDPVNVLNKQVNKQNKEDKNMTTLTMIFTLCGAATIARGLMEIIARLDGE